MHISKSKSSLLKAMALTGMVSGLLACSDDPATNYSQSEADAFKEACVEEGGTVHETTCDGQATCAGTFLDGETGEVVETTCAGKNSCAGIQCLPGDATSSSSDGASSGAMSSSDMMSSSADPNAAILRATSAEEFTSACESAGKSVTENSTCAGHNSCAGLYFNSAEGSVSEVTCSGKSSCAGLKCAG